MEQKNRAAAPTKDTATQLQEFREMEQSYKHIIDREKQSGKMKSKKIAKLSTAIAVLSSLLALSVFANGMAAMRPSMAADDTVQPTRYKHDIEPTATVTAPAVRYEITEAERTEIVKAVVCETGGQDQEAAILVAQCILNAAEHDGIRPSEVLAKYQYADYPVELTTTAFEAVSDVFDWGNTITSEPIMFFYAPDRVKSDWHESLEFVTAYAGHRYFKLPTEKLLED